MSAIYERKVIIVGKTGNGKSSLGNTILKRKAFTASKGFEAVTTECKLEANIGKITVVDTPGLFDTRETNGSVKKITSNALSILESLDICCKPHAILFTLNGACRLTDEELSVIDVLTIIFGKDWTDHAIVVVTHIDNDEEESEFKENWEDCEKLNNFVKKCKGRICTIDNKHPIKEHVDRILDNIDEVSQKGTCPFSVKYIDCKKTVLQNEEKLEDYNGMPTHRIIEEIGKRIFENIKEDMRKEETHRQEMMQIEKKRVAESEEKKQPKLEEERRAILKRKNDRYKKIIMYTTTGVTIVATTAIAIVVGPFKVAVAGTCIGGASVAAGVNYIFSLFDRR